MCLASSSSSTPSSSQRRGGIIEDKVAVVVVVVVVVVHCKQKFPAPVFVRCLPMLFCQRKLIFESICQTCSRSVGDGVDVIQSISGLQVGSLFFKKNSRWRRLEFSLFQSTFHSYNLYFLFFMHASYHCFILFFLPFSSIPSLFHSFLSLTIQSHSVSTFFFHSFILSLFHSFLSQFSHIRKFRSLSHPAGLTTAAAATYPSFYLRGK